MTKISNWKYPWASFIALHHISSWATFWSNWKAVKPFNRHLNNRSFSQNFKSQSLYLKIQLLSRLQFFLPQKHKAYSPHIFSSLFLPCLSPFSLLQRHSLYYWTLTCTAMVLGVNRLEKRETTTFWYKVSLKRAIAYDSCSKVQRNRSWMARKPRMVVKSMAMWCNSNTWR